MLFSAFVDYWHGLWIERHRDNNKKKAKFGLISSLMISVLILSFFKYADFLIETVNGLIGIQIALLELPLPIGLSFYTFQTMSYTIDVYRGRVTAQRNPIALALYVCLFPQLIAGPIVRYKMIALQLTERKFQASQFSEGVQLFIIGLAKKVLLANNIGLLWREVAAQDPSELSILLAWLGIIAFAFQIYFDFSGYSDMAIGLGKMFGFDFPKNFHYPYMARSISEFWRRWHMTLGAWFRDYVYIPLGGSEHGKWKLYRNLFIVWGLTGIWHGASWNFALWGLYFGLFIAIEKAGWLRILEKAPKWMQHFYFIFFILIGWVLFVFEDISLGFLYLQAMFGLLGNAIVNQAFVYEFYRHFVLLVILVLASLPTWTFISKKTSRFKSRQPVKWLMESAALFYLFFLLFLSTAYLVSELFNPFLYFRF